MDISTQAVFSRKTMLHRARLAGTWLRNAFFWERLHMWSLHLDAHRFYAHLRTYDTWTEMGSPKSHKNNTLLTWLYMYMCYRFLGWSWTAPVSCSWLHQGCLHLILLMECFLTAMEQQYRPSRKDLVVDREPDLHGAFERSGKRFQAINPCKQCCATSHDAKSPK